MLTVFVYQDDVCVHKEEVEFPFQAKRVAINWVSPPDEVTKYPEGWKECNFAVVKDKTGQLGFYHIDPRSGEFKMR
jgi:hypothetical protein